MHTLIIHTASLCLSSHPSLSSIVHYISIVLWIYKAPIINPSLFNCVVSQRLLSERDTLRETNEELRCVQVQQKGLSETGG